MVAQTDLWEGLLSPIAESLSEEGTKRLMALRASPKLQARVDELAAKANEGLLTEDEAAEYDSIIHYSTLISILKAKVRRRVSQTAGT